MNFRSFDLPKHSLFQRNVMLFVLTFCKEFNLWSQALNLYSNFEVFNSKNPLTCKFLFLN